MKLRLFLAKAWIFLRKDVLEQATYRFALIINIVAIFFGVAAYFYLSQFASGVAVSEAEGAPQGYFSFILIGMAGYAYMNFAIGTFSNQIRQAQTLGILESMMLTRTRLGLMMLLSNLSAFGLALMQVFFYLGIGAIFFKLDLSRMHVGSTVLVLALLALALLPFGMLSASYTLAFKKGDPIFFGLSMLSVLLGGIYYPLSVLPAFLQKVALFLPITVGIKALRKALLQGVSPAALSPELGRLLVLLLIFGPLAALLLKKALRYAQLKGNLA